MTTKFDDLPAHVQDKLKGLQSALIKTRQAFQRFLVLNHKQDVVKRELDQLDKMILETVYPKGQERS